MGEVVVTGQLALDEIGPDGASAAVLRPHGQTLYRTEGHRWGTCVCRTYGTTDGPQLAVTVAAEDQHPFDFGPTALLDVARVRDLHAATGAWLAEHDPDGGAS